ncbi:MAG: HpcH/HpaI aldolase family protein [Gemmobacter sp.]|uniref:HpcH/HpaI aldolase family protein n=1 Tax=Gemmobacter sp. TaxID=1898957 RepID=UPI00391C58F3
MPAPVNGFKAALAKGKVQVGLWVAFASPNVAELLSHCGYDWLVIDGEHAPNDLPLMLAQLQAMQAGGAHPVVRVPVGEPWLMKQVLDIGAQTVLVPMVDTAEQARKLVRAMRYPPEGIRGMGTLGRASRYGLTPEYLTTANAQTCLLVQVETRMALENLEEICAVDGVDGVFIGPSDLSADMGYPGNSGAPEVQAAIDKAIARIVASGKAAGILVAGAEPARHAMAQGATFVAAGHDVGLLRAGALALRAALAGK